MKRRNVKPKQRFRNSKKKKAINESFKAFIINLNI